MSIVFQATDELNGSSLIKAINNALLIFTTLGLAGILSNIIQFGTDQLRDASTYEITSFIVWYMWTWIVGIFFGELQNCFCGTWSPSYLLLHACVSLALCLDSLFNHWLIKEPVV